MSLDIMTFHVSMYRYASHPITLGNKYSKIFSATDFVVISLAFSLLAIFRMFTMFTFSGIYFIPIAKDA